MFIVCHSVITGTTEELETASCVDKEENHRNKRQSCLAGFVAGPHPLQGASHPAVPQTP